MISQVRPAPGHPGDRDEEVDLAAFPAPGSGVQYLTEGGQETEVMYEHGFDLPEFAMFPLLDRDDAMAARHVHPLDRKSVV